MKSFGTALILTSVASAVNVQKARTNPAYAVPIEHHEPTYGSHVEVAQHHEPVAHHYEEEPVYEVVSEPYETHAPQEDHHEFEAAPRYWDDHLHYKGPTWVDFSTPEPYTAPAVSHALPAYAPYIPKYKNHYVDVEEKHTYNDFGDLFTPYNFYAPPEEDLYGDPIYEPKHDKLHQKQHKNEAVIDIHDHGDHEEEHHEPAEEEHHEPAYHHEEPAHEYTEEYSHCDCSDVAAERDQATIERDDAVSKLYLYQLAYGDILPESAYPVYETHHQEETSHTYEPEYTHYDPYSNVEEHHEVPEHHYKDDEHHYEVEEEHHYEPTEEEINYFDQDDYSVEGYSQHNTGSYSYLDHVLNSYNDGYENYAETDYGHNDHGFGGHDDYDRHDDNGHNDGHHEQDNHHGSGYSGDDHGHGH